MSGFSNVVVVGDWAPYRGQAGITEVGGMSLCFCPPRLRDLEAELRRWEPCWLLVGGVEEGVVERLLGRLIPAHPRVRVAMLGEGWDRQRCERWLRWGCDAYLSAAAPAERVLGLLRVAIDCRVLLVDADLEMVRSRPRRVEASLSPIQRRVLLLVAEGRRNWEIAQALGVSPATVAYHLRQLLARLGVETRQEAVARAMRAGVL
ncbi:MAG TPA: LuxR C-terminal-related transcriptional regulator [Candidatus Dormibacteraeota bacterium]|nr:LuxR C-terminal-related transcriptional regulator [Candidatus Dormibacteraeota bacterium]